MEEEGWRNREEEEEEEESDAASRLLLSSAAAAVSLLLSLSLVTDALQRDVKRRTHFSLLLFVSANIGREQRRP